MAEIRVMHLNEREFVVEENRAFLDENNIQNLILVGDTDEFVTKELVHGLKKISRNVEGKVHTLVDLNRAGKASTEMRKVGRQLIEEERTGKVALYGLHPVARVLASFIIGLTQKSDIRFFKTREEAYTWLLE